MNNDGVYNAGNYRHIVLLTFLALVNAYGKYSFSLAAYQTLGSPNKHRVFAYTDEITYGLLSITWAKEPSLHFGLKDIKGDVVMDKRISLLSISPY